MLLRASCTADVMPSTPPPPPPLPTFFTAPPTTGQTQQLAARGFSLALQASHSHLPAGTLCTP